MLTRRSFLQSSSAAAVAAASSGASILRAAQPDTMRDSPVLPIIDCHQHLWDLKKFDLPWLDGVKRLDRSFVTKDYLKAIEGQNVVQAVYMEVDVAPEQHVAEAKHILQLCRDKTAPTSAAVISGRPAAENFEKYIRQFTKEREIKGIRQVLHVPETKAGYCLSSEFMRGIQLLGELGLSFDLCMRPTELNDAFKLAQECPRTRFILDHCGNGDPRAFGAGGEQDSAKPIHQAKAWQTSISRLAECDNVICKISGIVVRAPQDNWTADQLAPVVNHCLDAFGADRVVFGSDWPVCTLNSTYAAWVKALQQIVSSRPASDQRRLFHDNAVKLYGLDT